MLNRRDIIQKIGAGAASFLLPNIILTDSVNAKPNRHTPDNRVRLLDISTNTLSYPDFKKLKDAGFLAVGRYYSRKPDTYDNAPACGYPSKILMKNELDAIEKAGLAVFTVFQHCNHCPGFYDPSYPQRFANKGKLDGEAARDAAMEIDQPTQTPIYFGVDFNPKYDGSGKPECNGTIFRDNNELEETIKQYFRDVNDVLRPANYRVGVYGGGHICNILRKEIYKEQNLAEFFWLAASIGYKGHAEFYKNKKWHIYQNKIELKGIDYLKDIKIDGNIDVDITNPDLPYFGQWQRKKKQSEMVVLSKADASNIMNSRGFYGNLQFAFSSRNPKTGELKDETLISNIDGLGHTFRILERFPANGAYGASVGVNFGEGDQTRHYVYTKDVVLGLDFAHMPRMG